MVDVTRDGDTSALRDVLERFGVTAGTAHRIERGRFNEHWSVDEANQTSSYVLRRYNAQRDAVSIAFEHDVLRSPAMSAWPVAAPETMANGASLVEAGGRLYALFRRLPGALGPAYGTAHIHLKGRLLARLHGDLARVGVDGQRPGFGRVWELDTRERMMNDVLRDFGETQRELGWAIRAQRYRSLRELSRLGYGDLPDTLIHFDFTRENLLFDDGRLTGVLDFDHVHFDARAVDIAWTIISDCTEPPEDTSISIELAGALVAGYAEQSALDERELRLVVPLMRARHLSLLNASLRLWLADPNDDLLFRIDRRVRRRLPQLDEREAALTDAILRAAP